MKNSKKKTYDLIIVGGGIMGLMTMYYANKAGKSVGLVDSRKLFNSKAASSGTTRSRREDYLDPKYSNLSYEALNLWRQIEEENNVQFLYRSGCMNLATIQNSGKIENSYAYKANCTNTNNGFDFKEYYGQEEVKKIYKDLNADYASIDLEGDVLYLPEINKFFNEYINTNNIDIFEDSDITRISEGENVEIKLNTPTLLGTKAVITSGRWTNDVLQKIVGVDYTFPITKDRPSENRFYPLDGEELKKFSYKKFPILAYLDSGIYLHPVLDGKTKGIKIGIYYPPEIKRNCQSIFNIDDFINECLPYLRNHKWEDISKLEECYYQIVIDNEFILGKLPKTKRIFVGCGWNGTGYKFATIIGKILMELSIRENTVYDISQFRPDRFF